MCGIINSHTHPLHHVVHNSNVSMYTVYTVLVYGTSGRFKSYRSGGSCIILRARSILMTFIIFGNSSCIIFAVVRSTLLLLHFHLHSLFFRSYLVSLQYFDDFCSYAALVHVSFLLLCAVLRCFWAFICILCAFVISLCAHSILMICFISGNNSCSIFALCVVLCWFCTCVYTRCFFVLTLCLCNILMAFYHIRQ